MKGDREANGGRRLDNPLAIERIYDADREAMKAALRVVLGLPKRLPGDDECKS